jgi:hypothetical protein
MNVGDLVEFKGRTGTVIGFQPKGMVDVEFDTGVERRRKEDLSIHARTNGERLLPWWGWGFVVLGVGAALLLRARK